LHRCFSPIELAFFSEFSIPLDGSPAIAMVIADCVPNATVLENVRNQLSTQAQHSSRNRPSKSRLPNPRRIFRRKARTHRCANSHDDGRFSTSEQVAAVNGDRVDFQTGNVLVRTGSIEAEAENQLPTIGTPSASRKEPSTGSRVQSVV